jgi:hypothetical protein
VRQERRIFAEGGDETLAGRPCIAVEFPNHVTLFFEDYTYNVPTWDEAMSLTEEPV